LFVVHLPKEQKNDKVEQIKEYEVWLKFRALKDDGQEKNRLVYLTDEQIRLIPGEDKWVIGKTLGKDGETGYFGFNTKDIVSFNYHE